MSPRITEPRRVFLGWTRPCLESAAEFLIEAGSASESGDGARASGGGAGGDAPLVVVPGGRARRTLLAMLADGCEAKGLVLTPPTIVTPGEIGDAMLAAHHAPGARVAPPMVRRLAWIESLRRSDAGVVETLLPRRPAEDDLVEWSALASILEQRHDELAGELLLFADVPAAASGMPDFADDERWHAAAEVQRRYADVLDGWGVADPALVRLHAVREAAPVANREVVLVGVPELNRATRTILERAPGLVTALVFAPEEMSSRFDALGCVDPEAWAGDDGPGSVGGVGCVGGGGVDLGIREEHILVAEGPDDQADAALEAIAMLKKPDGEDGNGVGGSGGGAYATDEIVIGVPDRSIVPYLRQRAERYGAVEVRYAGGTALARTPVYRLLVAVASFLEEGTLGSLASLVRHPDVEARIERAIGRGERRAAWLDDLDEYQSEHLQTRADGTWVECHPRRLGVLRGVHRALLDTLGALAPDATGDAAPRKPIGEWTGPILDVLGRVYGGVERNRFGDDRLVVEACLCIRDAARALARHAGEMHVRATPAQAIRLLLEQVSGAEIPERPDDETVELLGWLELALDPAPVVVVTGMNEGMVPSTIVGDVLLPDRLRATLGVADDRRRVARDAFLLSAIVGSREHARLVVGRQSPEGDPLKPSRLLLRCDAETVVTRFARLTSERRDEQRRVELVSHLEHGGLSLYRKGPIVGHEPPTEMSVTSFRAFLTSPYQFYLRHVIGVKERDDAARELDGAAFGNLLHGTLEAFGRSDARDLLDTRSIEAALMDLLTAVARQRLGPAPTAPVAIQIELARLRLREFARRQAAWAARGWRIVATEWRPADKRAAFDVDSQTMWLKGKIDRIDRNTETGRLAVLDYKTGERVTDPDSALGRDGWTDLQLPLYRHLAAEFGPMEGAVLGYVTLPRRQSDVQFREAPWGDAELASADETARDVVRRVRAGAFGVIGDPWVGSASVAALCGIGLIGESAADADGDGGEA